jgi:hypothetical protein
MFQDIPIVGSGFWAEVKAGGQHLRLFVVETMLGLGANVFSVTDRRWLDAGPHWFQTFGDAKQWRSRRPKPIYSMPERLLLQLSNGIRRSRVGLRSKAE